MDTTVNNKLNLILSGGGVKGYAHLGVYRYLYERGFTINEIVSVSSGSLVAPFVASNHSPQKTIELMKEERPDKKLFPWWVIPDKFEIFFGEPDTYPVGQWLQKQFHPQTLLSFTSQDRKLHVLGARNPRRHLPFEPVDMLSITTLDHAFAASSAILGVFKPHRLPEGLFIDGGHWNNVPIYFPFRDNSLPVVAVNLGYSGRIAHPKGRISKIMHGIEMISYARFTEDVQKWTSLKQNQLITVNPEVWHFGSLDFKLNEKQIDEMIELGYKATFKALKSLA